LDPAHLDPTAALDERLTRLEEKVGKPVPIEERLAALEAAVSRPKGKNAWEKAQIILQALAPVLAGVVVAVAGYLLTGRITNALGQRQLELGNITQMRDILVRLETGKADGKDLVQEEMNANATALAAFGSYAAPSLIELLRQGGDVKVRAAETGLESLALSDPAAACAQLGRVLANRTQAFPWQAHLHVLRLAGTLACRDMLGALRAYRALLTTGDDRTRLDAYKAAIDPAAELDSLEQLAAELDRAEKLLGKEANIERP
jgi:hypothetical protein